ncbi:MAG: hypothetical protein JWR10_272 [Rubritepida sp.]|nr:hypothetical protein [Rubritepida sp.]
MVRGGRELFRALMHRSTGPFVILVTTLLLSSWLLHQQASHASEQAALALASQSAARAALALKGEILTIEARLQAAQREGRPVSGVAVAPLAADVADGVAGAIPGQLRFVPVADGTQIVAALTPFAPGMATASLRVPTEVLGALLTPMRGTALRLISSQGIELAERSSPSGIEFGPSVSQWVHEGSLRVEGIARPDEVPLLGWVVPICGIFILVLIFRQKWALRERVQRKLGALRASLARHAAQLSVNEARMRLSQTERVAAERRDAALIEAWPGPAALIDSAERLCAWNTGFGSLMPTGVLRRDLQLGMLMRHLEIVTPGPRKRGPVRVRVRLTLMSDGSRIIEGLADEAASTTAAEALRMCRLEFEARAPQLREAVVAGDAEAARDHAHALRGLAVNFGLADLAQPLQRIERGAADDDTEELNAGLAGFEAHFEVAMRQLGSLSAQPGAA